MEQHAETGFATDEEGHGDMGTRHSQVEKTQTMVDGHHEWLGNLNNYFLTLCFLTVLGCVSKMWWVTAVKGV